MIEGRWFLRRVFQLKLELLTFLFLSYWVKYEEWCITDKHWSCKLFVIWQSLKAKKEKLSYFLIYSTTQLNRVIPIPWTELNKVYKAAELESMKNPKSERSLWTQCQAVADLKFTYVVICQIYGEQKK